MLIIYIDFAMIYFYFRPSKNLIYKKQLLHPAKHITFKHLLLENVDVIEVELSKPALIPKTFKKL